MHSDYPYADTEAARMLHSALRKLSAEGTSLREIGRQLGYKQPVAISHMSLGRVPIPLDRAEDLADAVGINKAAFLRATAEQRHPEVDWSLIADGRDSFANQLVDLCGTDLDDLPSATKRVIREVVLEPVPDRRWLSQAEVPVIEQIRAAVPYFRSDGVGANKIAELIRAINGP